MMRLTLALCFALILSAGGLEAQAQASTGQDAGMTVDSTNGYRLVYRHDAQGKALHGSLDQLRRAVRAGLEVRVGWGGRHPEQQERSVEHVADAAFLTILSGEHVLAQVEAISGQAPDFEEKRIHFRVGATWRMIASTRGEMVGLMLQADGSGEEGPMRPRGFSWFVRGEIPGQAGPLWDPPVEAASEP